MINYCKYLLNKLNILYHRNKQYQQNPKLKFESTEFNLGFHDTHLINLISNNLSHT